MNFMIYVMEISISLLINFLLINKAVKGYIKHLFVSHFSYHLVIDYNFLYNWQFVALMLLAFFSRHVLSVPLMRWNLRRVAWSKASAVTSVKSTYVGQRQAVRNTQYSSLADMNIVGSAPTSSWHISNSY